MSEIDCIIYGKNCEKHLRACVASVKESNYPRGEIRLFYLDQGSTDRSVKLAEELGLILASGWEAGSAPLIQYLFAERTLDLQWLGKATRQMMRETAAVRGKIENPDPQKNWATWISYLELNPPTGEIRGDQLIRRNPVGKEETILSEPMAYGPSSIKGWEEWWNFAGKLPMDRNEVLIRGGGSLLLLLLMIFGLFWTFWWIILLLPAAILLLYPRIFEVEKIKEAYHITSKEAAALAWHRSLRVIPRFFRFRSN